MKPPGSLKILPLFRALMKYLTFANFLLASLYIKRNSFLNMLDF